MNINKTLAALLVQVAAFATVVVQSPSSAITSTEWLGGFLGLLTVLGVYQVANGVKPAPIEPDLAEALAGTLEAPEPTAP